MRHSLIVEDDVNAATMIAGLLSSHGWSVARATSLRDARRHLAERPVDLLLLDLQLPDGSGLDLFGEDGPLDESSCVVFVTGHASIDSTVQALRLGATDYLIKPVDVARLERLISRLGRESGAARSTAATSGGAPPPAPAAAAVAPEITSFGHLVGAAPQMLALYRTIGRVAPSDATVLISGESGSGKELVARTLYEMSARRDRTFITVNCGAISPNLIESELFGHEKGSFTGAERAHRGFFERAHEGTLFLDEVTEMSIDLQAKLLRVIETGTFVPLGGDEPRLADVRLIAATNRDPLTAVRTGRLREDLWYRLNVFPIAIPPLRERRSDIPLLARHLIAQISGREGQERRFSDDALDRLAAMAWPGNVRELRNAVSRAYVMAEGPVITAADLGLEAAAASRIAGPAAQSGPGASATTDALESGSDLARMEKEMILATLARFNGHRERTAAALGVSLKTLYNRLREYDAPRGRRGRIPRR